MQVAAASQVLSRADLRQRQFTNVQRGSLGTTDIGLWIYGIAFAGMTFFFGAYALLYLPSADGLPFVILFGLPVVVVVLMGGGGFMWALGRRRRFEDLCAAQPPIHPGDPACCRVCGGPVSSAKDGVAVVRCGHCAADNLVSVIALERARARSALVFTDYERWTASQAVSVGGVTAASGVVLVVLSVLTPVLAFGIAMIAVFFGMLSQ